MIIMVGCFLAARYLIVATKDTTDAITEMVKTTAIGRFYGFFRSDRFIVPTSNFNILLRA